MQFSSTIGQAVFNKDAYAVARLAKAGASAQFLDPHEDRRSLGVSSRRKTLSLFGLMIEACKPNLPVARALIAHGASPDGIPGEEPPLARLFSEMPAYHSSRTWTVSQKAEHALACFLLASGANPNVVDRSGASPLMRSAQAGDLEMLNELLSLGADPDFVNDAGVSALGLACRQSHTSIVKILLEVGRRRFWTETGPSSVLAMARDTAARNSGSIFGLSQHHLPSSETLRMLAMAQEVREISDATPQAALAQSRPARL